MPSSIRPAHRSESIDKLRDWTLDRLQSGEAVNDLKSMSYRNMRALATVIAVELSEGRPLTTRTCWVPGVHETPSYRAFLATISRAFHGRILRAA